MALTLPLSRVRLAPDLARLPIAHNPRAPSVAEGVRAGLSVSVILAASEYFRLPLLREAALAALWTCLCDPGGPVRRRVPALLSFTVIGALTTGVRGVIRSHGPEGCVAGGRAGVVRCLVRSCLRSGAAADRVDGGGHATIGGMK